MVGDLLVQAFAAGHLNLFCSRSAQAPIRVAHESRPVQSTASDPSAEKNCTNFRRDS
jgi:hypothetical protein